MIVAVDFDGTLQFQDGKANIALFHALRTCRSGQRLAEAVRFCQQHGLRPNYINQNTPQIIKMLGHDPRKVYADLYIDDKAHS